MQLKSLLKYLVPLIIIIVVVLVFLISSNRVAVPNADKSLAYPAPNLETSYGIVLNQDKSISYRFFTAKLERFETKKYLLSDYVVLTLRPINGDGPVDQTYMVALPANLNSSDTKPTSPLELQKSVDKILSFGITYKQEKSTYTFLDVTSWSLFAIL